MRITPVLALLAWIALSALCGAQNEAEQPAQSTTRQAVRQVEGDQLLEQQLEALTTRLHLRLDQRAKVRELLGAEIRHKRAWLQHSDKVTLSSARVLPPTVPGAPRRAPTARQPTSKKTPAAQKKPVVKKPVAKKPARKKPVAKERPPAGTGRTEATHSRPPSTSTEFLGEMRPTTLDKLRRWLDTSQRERFSKLLGTEGQERLQQLSQQRQAAWKEVGYGKQLAQPNIQRKAPRPSAGKSRGRPAAKKKGQRNNGRRRVVRRRPNNNGGSSGGSNGGGSGDSGGGFVNRGGGSSNQPPRQGKSKSAGGKPPR